MYCLSSESSALNNILDFCHASSLKQQSIDRHVVPLWHIVQTVSKLILLSKVIKISEILSPSVIISLYKFFYIWLIVWMKILFQEVIRWQVKCDKKKLARVYIFHLKKYSCSLWSYRKKNTFSFSHSVLCSNNMLI